MNETKPQQAAQTQPPTTRPAPKRRRPALSRRMKDSLMADLGLVRVRGARGGVYYE